MTPYNTFQVTDENDVGYDFSVQDVVCVLPNGRHVGAPIELHEYWICRILDIRARNDTDVWVKIEWFYSAQDAARESSSFVASHCGRYERLKSNHSDCVSTSVFNGMASIKYYDETNLNQEPIFADDFYYRYTIDLPDLSISPTPAATCVCGCLYDPSDIAPGSVMHLCPRPKCRKYYHRGCISPSKGKGAPISHLQRVDFLLTDPDTGAALELPLNESASAEPPKKRRRASHVTDPAAFSAPIAALPQKLVRAAAQPIVRGGALGVAGNVAAVVAARRLVCRALRDGVKVEAWPDQMPKDWEKSMPDGWDAEGIELDAAEVTENGVPNSESNISVSGGKRGKERRVKRKRGP
ncbi:hypothetical protein B0H16DRAFT_1429274 [Mycena metata]|uniref:BAH domain-containing protein n=1 Tax=Mycena metata TaxID=1033252 RepID=A0AAD7MQ15_9AGAR|nr:hypothetical protein B0H16DRAFT_1429274 [Mycena metata]